MHISYHFSAVYELVNRYIQIHAEIHTIHTDTYIIHANMYPYNIYSSCRLSITNDHGLSTGPPVRLSQSGCHSIRVLGPPAAAGGGQGAGPWGVRTVGPETRRELEAAASKRPCASEAPAPLACDIESASTGGCATGGCATGGCATGGCASRSVGQSPAGA
jgi:hypothetical protein